MNNGEIGGTLYRTVLKTTHHMFAFTVSMLYEYNAAVFFGNKGTFL
jgi:hypothetical protein